MIRRLTIDDKVDALRLIGLFFEEKIERLGFSKAEDSDRQAEMFLEHPNGVCLGIEKDGSIVGIAYAFINSNPFIDGLIATELVWYVDPKHRRYGLRLFTELENAVRDAGAEKLIMIRLAGDDNVERFYEMSGYKEIEKHFVKEL